ncbi:hypothetical protein BJF85_04800 [Saccharomonospora sp. CUA-673]|nr:hypothetical protein BJF85_04800 [Saccharomonospora sp. CUA-673]
MRALRSILVAMSAPDWRDWYSLKVAKMPCMSCPTGEPSIDSVAETSVTPRLRRSAMTIASSYRLRAMRESM